VSDAPGGSSRVPELLKLRVIDVALAALLLGVAAVFVFWLLDIPGTRLWIFVATAVAIVLYLALALTRLRAVRRVVVERLAALPRDTAVVALTEVVPAYRSPTLFVQRRPEGLWFERASDPAQTALLEWGVIQKTEVTTFPVSILLTLTDGTRVRLAVVTSRLSTPRATDVERLRGWMKTGSAFPVELGATSFAPVSRT
jgi:hypothetical protein